MKKTAIIFFIFLFVQSFGQNNAESEFIVSFFKNRKENINYTDKISDYGVKYIKGYLKSIDTIYQNNFPNKVKDSELPGKIVLTDLELKEVIKKFERSISEGWIKNKVPNSTYIEPERVGSDSYYCLFKPIMIRENTICFFFFGKSREFGKLSVFIKKNGEWIYFARIVEWAT